MIQIVLTVCSILHGASCKEVALASADENATEIACQMGVVGVAEAAKWIAEHPNYSLARWHCQVAGQFAKI